ncbi:hypothetical protein [Streptomyces sp. GbtcB7]|uniref:hypothetical protein n=1 Tax=Streptomyces sp. GbtcB7 TaxID=2824752 RepID=UPI001C302490|nr:hypothetical protein [Streptomyces sp. GbtcB7]
MGDRPGLAQALKPANNFLAATTLAATSAGTFITVLVLWDLLGHLPLPLGVAGHEGSTVLVGLNGLRLLRESAWRRPDGGRPRTL